MFTAGARRAHSARSVYSRRRLEVWRLATFASQASDPRHVSLRSRVAYGITAATGGLAAYSVFHLHNSVTRPYSSYERADAPRKWPDSDKDVVDDDPSKDEESDKPEDTSYAQQWNSFSDRIRNLVAPPDWALQLPDYMSKIQKDLSDEPGSLAHDIWAAAQDAAIHPEITRDASVRVSDELCKEEKQYREKRKHYVRKALAKYLQIPEREIHPDDVPVIGMCGSGGGLRAMVAGASSYLSAEDAGLYDCVTYTAGVSGSCWLQAVYNSSLTHQSFGALIEHLKSRIGIHIAFPPPLLKMLTSAPTKKYLLAGGLEKWKGYKDADFGLVDVYGLLLGARLLVPKDDLNVNPHDIKLSHQRQYVDDGAHPLPLYSAVRHEIPAEDSAQESVTDMKEDALRKAWFQWFEFSPYELFCEEFGCGIPTWSIGRRFDNGHSVHGENSGYLPETRLTLLMGIFGSAFCATLSHYYKEIRPAVASLPGFGSLDSLVGERDDDLAKLHPVAPAMIPNYAMGMKDSLPRSCPASVDATPTIELMDAGMSNNLPIYPLLRPGRDVDIIVAFDASADVKQDNWLRAVDGYVRQRGVRGWPLGCGWPDGDAAQPEQTGAGMDEADEASAENADAKLRQAKREGGTLDYCTVWVGTTEERVSDDEPPPSAAVEDDWELMRPDAGIAVVYFPFVANPAVEGVDPQTSDFLSTWNFIYTPENVDGVVALAKANFKEGEERTRRTIRAVYERKKKQRLEREGKSRAWNIRGTGEKK